jgi:hypothetical protein
MNINIFTIHIVVLLLLLYSGLANAIAETSGMRLLKERFPDAIERRVEGNCTLAFCPDNTCDLFITKRSTSVDVLGDFALLYLYFFSDYFVLADWRTEGAARNTVSEVLKKYERKKCANASEIVMAQCLLRDWSKRYSIRLYWVRYDEKNRNLQPRSILEATKLQKSNK